MRRILRIPQFLAAIHKPSINQPPASLVRRVHDRAPRMIQRQHVVMGIAACRIGECHQQASPFEFALQRNPGLNRIGYRNGEAQRLVTKIYIDSRKVDDPQHGLPICVEDRRRRAGPGVPAFGLLPVP